MCTTWPVPSTESSLSSIVQSVYVDHFKGNAGRKFRSSYTRFWSTALRALGELDVLQEALLEPLQNLLTSLVT